MVEQKKEIKFMGYNNENQRDNFYWRLINLCIETIFSNYHLRVFKGVLLKSSYIILQTKMSTESKIRDISLAEWGRKEIELAEHEMPGLMSLRE